jgi:putative DNA primase/helicase
MTHLGIEDDLAGCARSFAFTAGLHPDDFTQPLQDLIQAIVVALQDYDDQVKQARAARAQQAAAKSPASGGIPMIARFKVQPDGVWYDDGQTPPVWVCSELKIIGGSRDEHHDHHGHALEFRDRYGYPQRWAMPLEMLEDRREYRKVLRRLGLQTNSSKQGIELLQAYLDLWQAQDAMICVERTGWYHGMYVLPDATFGQAPHQEKVVLQGLSHTVEGYRQAGTLAEWQAKVAALCVGNSRLLFAVSMAFASVVLALLDMEGGGVHLRGQSSEGKTTALLVAASVWGEPGRLEHWRATANGLEGVASYHNDNLLLLDELK